jgi:hypothetical protein
MRKSLIFIFCLVYGTVLLIGYTETTEKVVLKFTMFVNKKIYEHTDYGEPPQLAVWLEQPESGIIRTIWVSHRTGKHQWKGKFECPTALPYWKSRHKMEKSSFRERSLIKRLIDAITGATPKEGEFTVKTTVPYKSKWQYFIEVNLSGDYNITFPSVLDDGTPDPDGNGQPSLIYRGEIEAISGTNDVPKLLGRTDQWAPVDSIIHDLTGITTAKNIFSEVQVFCVL